MSNPAIQLPSYGSGNIRDWLGREIYVLTDPQNPLLPKGSVKIDANVESKRCCLYVKIAGDHILAALGNATSGEHDGRVAMAVLSWLAQTCQCEVRLIDASDWHFPREPKQWLSFGTHDSHITSPWPLGCSSKASGGETKQAKRKRASSDTKKGTPCQ